VAAGGSPWQPCGAPPAPAVPGWRLDHLEIVLAFPLEIGEEGLGVGPARGEDEGGPRIQVGGLGIGVYGRPRLGGRTQGRDVDRRPTVLG
jgi:hypothetical protein